jgi:hypothetical protein
MRSLLCKKRVILPLIFLILILGLNIVKYPNVVYLPCDIPGDQMAITVPPFGIFIESRFKSADANNPCAHPLIHEQVHWKQYEQMGLFSFYYNYTKCFLASGRHNNWMEREAQEPCSNRKQRR